MQLQSDMLDSAVERCVAEGGCLPIVEGVQKGAQKTLQEELKVAVAAKSERREDGSVKVRLPCRVD